MGYIEKIEGNNSLKAGVGMNVNELKKIIESGEKINVEFKLSENDLTKDVYQSVCSFNNRNGGHIILGVVDQTKEIRGVNPQKTDKMLKDFQQKQFELQAKQMMGEEVNDEAMSSVQSLYSIMASDPLCAEYLQAEMRFSLMMKDVYEILGEAAGLGDMAQ